VAHYRAVEESTSALRKYMASHEDLDTDRQEDEDISQSSVLQMSMLKMLKTKIRPGRFKVVLSALDDAYGIESVSHNDTGCPMLRVMSDVYAQDAVMSLNGDDAQHYCSLEGLHFEDDDDKPFSRPEQAPSDAYSPNEENESDLDVTAGWYDSDDVQDGYYDMLDYVFDHEDVDMEEMRSSPTLNLCNDFRTVRYV